MNARERLNEVKKAAVTAFDTLFEQNANEIMDAQARAKAEGEKQGKAVKFKFGFKVSLDDVDHEAKHTLGWSFGFKRSLVTVMSDPDQPELPMGEGGTTQTSDFPSSGEADPEIQAFNGDTGKLTMFPTDPAPRAKRKRAKKAATVAEEGDEAA